MQEGQPQVGTGTGSDVGPGEGKDEEASGSCQFTGAAEIIEDREGLAQPNDALNAFLDGGVGAENVVAMTAKYDRCAVLATKLAYV